MLGIYHINILLYTSPISAGLARGVDRYRLFHWSPYRRVASSSMWYMICLVWVL